MSRTKEPRFCAVPVFGMNFKFLRGVCQPDCLVSGLFFLFGRHYWFFFLVYHFDVFRIVSSFLKVGLRGHIAFSVRVRRISRQFISMSLFLDCQQGFWVVLFTFALLCFVGLLRKQRFKIFKIALSADYGPI